jgi:hypothetical protein
MKPQGENRSAAGEYGAAGNSAVAELVEHGGGFVEGVRRNLAADFSGGSQGQNFAQILARAHGRGADLGLAGGHHDGREANIFGRQSDDEESSRPAERVKC